MPTRNARRITPIPVPGSARGVLLFGGTFDPPHRAHVEMARDIRDRLCGPGWWLVYVPAARNPLKETGPIASDAQRLAMLRLSTRSTPRCAIWRDEIDRKSSFWIETLERARTVLPSDVELRFLIGSDQARAFHGWKSPREVLALAEPIVMLRATPGEMSERRALAHWRSAMRRARFWTRDELATWESALDAHRLMPHAATDVREALAAGDAPRARAMLQRPVLSYLKRHGLYRA
jgi:nicotinate-nucleotide adenylyltransferase